MTREGGYGRCCASDGNCSSEASCPLSCLFLEYFFALFRRGWHFVTDFSICLSDGKGIGWGDFDSAWGLLCKMFLPVTHYAKLRIKLRIFVFRR